MVIDAHVHIATDERENPRARVENVIRNMDANGIDMAVCFPFSAGLEKQKKLAELIRPYPGRFIQLAFINPCDSDARDQLLYCLDELGCKGMKLHPWFGNFSLANIELLRPLMEILDARGLYVVVHCTSEDYRVHPVMFERLGREFPHVTIQMAHMGEVMAGEMPLVDEELYKAFVQAYGEASYQDRLVLHLRYEDNLSLEEIGKVLGLKTNSVNTKLYRARKNVREKIDKLLKKSSRRRE